MLYKFLPIQKGLVTVTYFTVTRTETEVSELPVRRENRSQAHC